MRGDGFFILFGACVLALALAQRRGVVTDLTAGRCWVVLMVVAVTSYAVRWWLTLAPDLRGALTELAVLVGVPALLVLVFLAVVWPTRWRYESVSGHLVRIARLTGTVYVLMPQGWVALTDVRNRIDA